MTMTSSGICTACLVVLVSLVVAGVLALGSPDGLIAMIAITMILVVTAIIFLRLQDIDRTPGG